MVSNHTMVLEAQSLCGGCWTPGGWEPPATIPSGASDGWQSESCGFMTGTEGWVKYRLRSDSSGANGGLIYIYWTNPFIGVTRPRVAIAGNSYRADCNEDESGAGSSFAGDNARPEGLTLDLVSARKNGDPATIDSISDLKQMLLGPLVLATAGIWERMELTYRLQTSGPSTLLPPPAPRTRSVETKPSPATFAGTWTGASVSVSLALTGYKKYRVTVTDRSQAGPLEFEADASLGLASLARPLQAFLEAELVKVGSERDEASILQSSTALAAMAATLREREPRPAGGPEWMATRDAREHIVATPPLTRKAIRDIATTLDLSAPAAVTMVTDALGEMAPSADYILHLGHGIALYLVRIEENGRVVDYQLHYQRVAHDGRVLVDTDLEYVIPIH